eukprot:gene21978-28065_t
MFYIPVGSTVFNRRMGNVDDTIRSTNKAIIYKSLIASNFSSWTAVSSAVVTASSNQLNGVATVGGHHYLVVGMRLTVFNSSDSGATWSSISVASFCDSASNLYSVSYRSTNFAIVAGTRGCMLRYYNGVWSRVVSSVIEATTTLATTSQSNFQYHSVHIASSSIAFAVDMYLKRIIRSVDAGVSWFIEQESTDPLYSISAYDYGIALAGMDLSGNRNGKGLVYVRSQDPSSQPSSMPSGHPSRQPSGQPSGLPSGQPSGVPSRQPVTRPSTQPTCQPLARPSAQPTAQPSIMPTSQPSHRPSGQPSRQPSSTPTGQPSCQPSSQPSYAPTSSVPTTQPTGHLLDGNWSSVRAIFGQTTYTFVDVKCMNTIVCVMVGSYYNQGDNRNEGVIARTPSGGVSSGSWTVVLSIPLLTFKAVTYCNGLFMTADQRGGFYVSTDTGLTWSNPYNVTTLAAHQSNFGTTVISSVAMNANIINGQSGVFMVGGNKVYHNLDSTYSTWRSAQQGTSSLVLNDVATNDGYSAFIVGNNGKSFYCGYEDQGGMAKNMNCSDLNSESLTTSHLYNVAMNPQGQAMAVAVDGTLLKYKLGVWIILPFKVAAWPYSIYGHILQFVTNSVAYVADAHGFVRVTKNGSTKWYNETLLAVQVSSPLFCLNFYSSSVSVVGNSIGGVFVKRPIPTPAPTTTMNGFTFAVSQGIQGTTRIRFLADAPAATAAVKATIAGVVPRLLVGDIQIGAVMDVSSIGSRRLAAEEQVLSSLKVDTLSVVRSQAAASGVLLTYTVTFVPTSADNYDSSFGFSRISLALTDAVSSGLFNSTLSRNARVFNAVSLLRAAVPTTDSLLSIGSVLTPFLLHSPIPSSHPSSRPSGQPTSRPTKKPSGQPTSLPTGQPSSHPSAEPTSVPTFTVATKYILAVESLIKRHTPSALFLKNVFYDVMARDAQVFDSCALWTAFLDDPLDYSATVGSKRISAVQLLQQNQLWAAPSIERCTDPDAANEIVTSMAGRNRQGQAALGSPATVIKCKGNKWVVNTCGSSSNGQPSSVAVCVNCNDPCTDRFCVPDSSLNPASANANYSTGYITLSPCVANSYDFGTCPVFDGVARVFSVELVSQEGGVYAVFFSLLTLSVVLVCVTMAYERSIDTKRKKVADSRVVAAPGDNPPDPLNMASIYPGQSAEEGRGDALFGASNPSGSSERSVKSSMMGHLQAILRYTYFSPRLTSVITRDSVAAVLVPRSEISVSERLHAGLFPFHFLLTPFHETLKTSRSLRVKYHILAFSRVVLVLFFMTLFFNSQYTPDDGTCAQFDNQAECLQPHTIFKHSVKTCAWIHSGEGAVLTTSDPGSALYVAQCVWSNYTVSMDIYFRLLLVTALVTSAVRHLFHNDLIEHLLFRSAASVYYSNILLAVLQLGINRHRLLYVRSRGRAVVRFYRTKSRQMWRTMFPSTAATDESPPITNVPPSTMTTNSSLGQSDHSSLEAGEIPSELRPAEGASELAVKKSSGGKSPQTAKVDVDRNTVSDVVSIQISDQGAMLLNEFKTALFTHRAIAMPSEAQCREFDLQWGLHPADGRLFGLDEGSAARNATCTSCSERLDPEIVLAEEMLAVGTESIDMHRELVAWTAHRQEYVDRKKKRKHFVVEPYEDSLGKGLFLLFLLDLLGRDSLAAMSLQRVVYDTVFHQSQPPTSSVASKVYLAGLLVADCLFVFYCIQYTREKPFRFMYVWLVLALLALLVDMIVIEGAELLWCKVVAPHTIDAQVGQAVEVLVGLIAEYQGGDRAADSLAGGSNEKERRHDKRRNAGLNHLGHADSGDKFCVSRYFAVSAAVCRVFRNVPHSAVISAYRDSLPTPHLATICHYDRDAYVRSRQFVETEDNTAHQVWTYTHQTVTRTTRNALYYTALWMSAKLPTQLQRVAVSSATVFLIFVLYCLVKLMLLNVVSGAIAVVLVGSLVLLVSYLMVRTLCPIGHARGSRIADELTAVESASERKKRSDFAMQSALEDVLGVGSPVRSRRVLHRGRAVAPSGADEKEGEPSETLSEQREEEKEEEGFALSDSEGEGGDADSDDDDSAEEGDEENDGHDRRARNNNGYRNTKAANSSNQSDSDDDRDQQRGVRVVDGWEVHV